MFLIAFKCFDIIIPLEISVHFSSDNICRDYFICHSGSEHICYKDALDFGINIPLGEVQKAYLIVENKSAIKTAFSLQAENFYPARIPSPPPGKIFYISFRF